MLLRHRVACLSQHHKRVKVAAQVDQLDVGSQPENKGMAIIIIPSSQPTWSKLPQATASLAPQPGQASQGVGQSPEIKIR